MKNIKKLLILPLMLLSLVGCESAITPEQAKAKAKNYEEKQEEIPERYTSVSGKTVTKVKKATGIFGKDGALASFVPGESTIEVKGTLVPITEADIITVSTYVNVQFYESGSKLSYRYDGEFTISSLKGVINFHVVYNSYGLLESTEAVYTLSVKDSKIFKDGDLVYTITSSYTYSK